MSTLLTSGNVTGQNYSRQIQRRIRQETINKWSELGFLEGLNGHVRENIAQLYEAKASCLLNEYTTVKIFGRHTKALERHEFNG